MKKLLLSLSLMAAMGANAQITIFEDSFETYTDFAISGVGNWTLTDVDLQETYGVTQGGTTVSFPNSGAAMAYIVMNGTASTPPLGTNWIGHTGNKCMAAMASIPDAPGNTNNDWLISPQVQLGSAGNVLKFWAKAISATYPEKFKVGISTTGTAPTDFTIITTGTGVTPTTTWTEYTYALNPTYQGQNVYIGIQCISNDAFAFMVDDFKVTTTTLGTNDFFKSNFAIYPNPANNVLNIAANNGTAIKSAVITDVNGRTVKNQNVNSLSTTEINVSDLTSGVYFISVESADGKGTSKFVKN